MFDIGFSEIALVLVLGLIVLGPQKLPIAIRTVAKWVKVLRELSSGVQHTLAQELKINELQGEIQKLSESTRAALKTESTEVMQNEINALKLTLASLQQQLNNSNQSTHSVEANNNRDVQSDNQTQLNYLDGVLIVEDDEADEDFLHYNYETDPIFLKQNRHPPRESQIDASADHTLDSSIHEDLKLDSLANESKDTAEHSNIDSKLDLNSKSDKSL
ncbi:Sec-independent protein translocase protein TatB [Thorsellia anophelis]|uniref:Sec-independent protein translocase protein TatB n=1 Tax=Thorsellia anophelis DSM 18579 TaxID=1123402 RepID=A0A1I0AQ12_9GAMM|nr:Sec-independent protein translocase protein TatB [Thorsellia anophelis]SES96506.1 sec-independent protein translocase protein TatB [Thorsellia anophelis DSM 18579]